MSESIRSSVKSYNKFLRESALQGNTMTMHLQSPQEQQLALETILTFVQAMSSGREKTKCLMKISLLFGDTERSLL